jgi:hypothetical protein
LRSGTSASLRGCFVRGNVVVIPKDDLIGVNNYLMSTNFLTLHIRDPRNVSIPFIVFGETLGVHIEY